MNSAKNCPPGNNVLTMDGQPFAFHRIEAGDELTCALRKLHGMAGNGQVVTMYALAETVDDNGNPHYAVVRFGGPNDNEAFYARLQSLANEMPVQTTTAAPGSDGGVEALIAEFMRKSRACSDQADKDRPQNLHAALCNEERADVYGEAGRALAALARRSTPATGGAARLDREAVAECEQRHQRCIRIAEMHAEGLSDDAAKHCAKSIAACIRDPWYVVRDRDGAILDTDPDPQPQAASDVVREALDAVVEAAKRMPRATPAPGGASTVHDFRIEAGIVWSLDQALRNLAVITPAGRVAETIDIASQK